MCPWLRNSGHVEDRSRYLEILGRCDVVASTARHEFFGVAFTEAMAAGGSPLAPDRLNYPALLSGYEGADTLTGLLQGPSDLAGRLVALARDPGPVRSTSRRRAARDAVMPFDADTAAGDLDRVIDGLAP